MADIAQIGFKADTSDLDTAKQKLEALPGAAQKAERASDKLSSTFDKSAEAAGKAATASAKLQEQINKTAAATEKAATTNLRSLKDEAAARLAAERAAGKEYSSGITSRAGLAPGARKNNGGIVPNFEQNSAQINAGLDKIIGKQEKATAANDNFEKGLEKTNATASKSGGVFSSLGATLTRLATGFIAVFSITKMIDWLSNANEATIKLGETAKRTGIDLERLQRLQFAGVTEGLSRSQVSTGLEGLAEKLNEARQTENELSKLFAENNIKLKDRKGEVISTNDALMKASGLIQNAATEFDKIKIAEALGLTREWIPLLEKGPDAINKIAEGAEASGNLIDSAMVKRAEDFRRDWATAVDRWVTMFQSAAGPILEIIDKIVSAVGATIKDIGSMLDSVRNAGVITRNAFHMMKGTATGELPFDVAKYQRDQIMAGGGTVPTSLTDRINQEPSNPLVVTVSPKRNKPAGGYTKTKSLFPDPKGGGGDGKTDQEKYDDIVTRAEANLAKLTAQREAIGLTAEAAAKLKFETDLLNQAKRADIELTDTQREKLMGLAGQMATTEVETKRLKEALEFGKDLTKGFLTDFLNGVKNGESVFKSFGNAALGVLNKISDKLISMAVDSLFTKGGTGAGGLLASFGKLIFGGGSALGNVFDGGGQVNRYAKGGAFTNGIYGSPQLFQFASGGKFGVMGEAGPEAVMPLSRGPDGSLGVEMHGGSNSGAVVNDVQVTNVYRIEGAVSEEKIVATIRATAERTTQDIKRNIVPWLNQYQQDGAAV